MRSKGGIFRCSRIEPRGDYELALSLHPEKLQLLAVEASYGIECLSPFRRKGNTLNTSTEWISQPSRNNNAPSAHIVGPGHRHSVPQTHPPRHRSQLHRHRPIHLPPPASTHHPPPAPPRISFTYAICPGLRKKPSPLFTSRIAPPFDAFHVRSSRIPLFYANSIPRSFSAVAIPRLRCERSTPVTPISNRPGSA